MKNPSRRAVRALPVAAVLAALAAVPLARATDVAPYFEDLGLRRRLHADDA